MYRGQRQLNAYPYLSAKDAFSLVPSGLMKMFRRPTLVLDFKLTPTRQLAAANAVQVLDRLQTQGYYLQVPAQDEPHK